MSIAFIIDQLLIIVGVPAIMIVCIRMIIKDVAEERQKRAKVTEPVRRSLTDLEEQLRGILAQQNWPDEMAISTLPVREIAAKRQWQSELEDAPRRVVLGFQRPMAEWRDRQ